MRRRWDQPAPIPTFRGTGAKRNDLGVSKLDDRTLHLEIGFLLSSLWTPLSWRDVGPDETCGLDQRNTRMSTSKSYPSFFKSAGFPSRKKGQRCSWSRGRWVTGWAPRETSGRFWRAWVCGTKWIRGISRYSSWYCFGLRLLVSRDLRVNGRWVPSPVSF